MWRCLAPGSGVELGTAQVVDRAPGILEGNGIRFAGLVEIFPLFLY